MTYCLGIKIRSGLVAIADTRLTSGNECSTGKKLIIHQRSGHAMFLMTSGLRSVRDKVMTYFHEVMAQEDVHFNKLYKAVNAYAEELRKVSREDKQFLDESGLHFNLNTIIGGQFEDDEEHKLYLVYPEGNWVEIGKESGSPFIIIGNTGYGKPLLNRALNYNSSIQFSLKTGFLSFDSTRVSANDVDFPIDVAIYATNSFKIIEKRYDRTDLHYISDFWQKMLSQSVDKIPEDWIEELVGNISQEKGTYIN
ncbi:MAG: peptidase [Bacteroidota bacterium]|nr:peptidase [Bacteroidota bacterium]